MNRAFCYGCLATLCFWTVQALVSAVRADDQPAKKEAQKKDAKDGDKDKKTEGVKRSQVRSVTKVPGKITMVDDKSLTLKIGSGKAERTVEFIIAEDVKVRVPAELEFDEKGRPKPPKRDPTDPDRRLGGVKGSKDDLREGQNVVAWVGRLSNKKKDNLVATIVVVLPEPKK